MNTYSLKRVLRTSFLGRTKAYLALRYYIKRYEIDYVIKKYLGEDVEPTRKRYIKRQMYKAMINYRWDLTQGCVLIEGNDKGRWSFQIPKQKGFRDEMNAILKEMGKKPLN